MSSTKKGMGEKKMNNTENGASDILKAAIVLNQALFDAKIAFDVPSSVIDAILALRVAIAAEKAR